MKARALFALGSALFATGLVKAATHAQTTDPFAAFWCRAPVAAEPAFALSNLHALTGHCWGCYAAAAGAALVLGALVKMGRAASICTRSRP